LRSTHVFYTDLRDANFLNADLRQAHMMNAVLEGANFTGADLSRANLEDADLTRARLDNAYLAGANLAGAVLREASLVDARLGHACLRAVDLWGARLQGADLSDADLRDLKGIYLLKMRDPRGHVPYANFEGGVMMIGSGSRYFTYEDALAHWGSEYSGNRLIGDRYLHELARLKADDDFKQFVASEASARSAFTTE